MVEGARLAAAEERPAASVIAYSGAMPSMTAAVSFPTTASNTCTYWTL